MAKTQLASNPVRQHRKQLNLNIAQLAQEVGLSEKTVYLNECGVYEIPSEEIVQYILRKKNVAPEIFYTEYANFRAKMRAFLRESLYPTVWNFSIPVENTATFRTELGTKLSPIADFRTNSLKQTRVEFAQKFLVNPGLLERLEAGRVFTSVPKPIIDALADCGAPAKFIKELYVRTKLFRESF